MFITIVCMSYTVLLFAGVIKGEYVRRNLDFEDIADDDNHFPHWFWNFSAPTCEEHKIWGNKGNEMFGSSVSIWDNLMIVGAQGDTTGQYQSGAAYVYFKYGGENSMWQLFYTLQANDGADGDRFGCAVSLGDHTAVIGASHADPMGQDSGAAYLYERRNPVGQNTNAQSGVTAQDYDDQSHLDFVMKLVPEDGSGQDYFGSAVAAHLNTTVVGAWGCDTAGTLAGCVYIWRKLFVDSEEGEWSFKQKVLAKDGRGYQRFGTSVSIFGDVIVVGAPGAADYLGSEVGAAYIFDEVYDDTEYDGRSWQQHGKLMPADGRGYDLFGQSVAVWEDSVMVGAPQHGVITQGKKGEFIENAGTAYSYTHTLDNRYFLVEEIEPLNPITDGHFGYSVDIYERMAAIGEHNEGDTGSVYVFREEEEQVYRKTIGHWIFDARRKSSHRQAGDMYGYSVSIFGAHLAVGAYGSSTANEDPSSGNNIFNNGGVYLYTGTYARVPLVEQNNTEEYSLDTTLVVLVSCLVVFGVSLIALICMYQDFKNRLSRNVDTIQYELAALDASQGMGSSSSSWSPSSRHGYPGPASSSSSSIGGAKPLHLHGLDASSNLGGSGPAINPLHSPPPKTAASTTASMDASTSGNLIDLSIGKSSHRGGGAKMMTRSSASSYGPAQDAMDESIRLGNRSRHTKGNIAL